MVYERRVTSLFCRGASWEVQTEQGDSEQFEAVVLTMPVPQVLQLQGHVGNGKTRHHQPAGSRDPHVT